MMSFDSTLQYIDVVLTCSIVFTTSSLACDDGTRDFLTGSSELSGATLRLWLAPESIDGVGQLVLLWPVCLHREQRRKRCCDDILESVGSVICDSFECVIVLRLNFVLNVKNHHYYMQMASYSVRLKLLDGYKQAYTHTRADTYVSFCIYSQKSTWKSFTAILLLLPVIITILVLQAWRIYDCWTSTYIYSETPQSLI